MFVLQCLRCSNALFQTEKWIWIVFIYIIAETWYHNRRNTWISIDRDSLIHKRSSDIEWKMTIASYSRPSGIRDLKGSWIMMAEKSYDSGNSRIHLRRQKRNGAHIVFHSEIFYKFILSDGYIRKKNNLSIYKNDLMRFELLLP